MTQIEQNAVIIFVPLLLTIVAQLSSLARDAVKEAGNWEQPPLLLPFSEGSVLPNLGRLNYLHATNYLLLLMGFILVVAMEPANGPLVKNLLGLMVLIVWLQLPLLEVDEYAAIRAGGDGDSVGGDGETDGQILWSLYLHVAATLAVAVYVVAFLPEAEVLTSVDLFSPEPDAVLQAAHPRSQAGLAALLVVAVVGFLALFRREVRGFEEPGPGEDDDGATDAGDSTDAEGADDEGAGTAQADDEAEAEAT